jgi:SAM-dependent methyltransferase
LAIHKPTNYRNANLIWMITFNRTVCIYARKFKSMKIVNPEKRLLQFWGQVDQKHIKLISQHLQGNNVLDMGCGLGTTTNYISKLKYNCIGIDYDQNNISYCNKKYPGCNFQTANAEQLPFEDGYFDTVILRDALHHFYGEADFNLIKKEILRVSKKHARIIILDPNINLILKTARKISFHKDEECYYETAISIVEEMGYNIIHKDFNTIYSLPLSGGYVGLNFVPNIPFIQKWILSSEIIFEKTANKIGLSSRICWRYLIVGQR